ncbi:hypothetical protein JOD18_004693 [Gracilibacillus alcaliphilus]|nr:hypothetical protein [Gracilibacillus alcaliphilus]
MNKNTTSFMLIQNLLLETEPQGILAEFHYTDIAQKSIVSTMISYLRQGQQINREVCVMWPM